MSVEGPAHADPREGDSAAGQHPTPAVSARHTRRRWLPWLLKAGILLEIGNLFAIAVTRGTFQLPPAAADRTWTFAGHAALAWLLLAFHETRSSAHADRSQRGYRLARLAVVALCLLGALVYVGSGLRLSSDGPHYFVQARSILFDHDLDFANDYKHVRAAHAIAERYPVGMALLSMPFLGLAHLLLHLGRLCGRPFVPDGFGYPYETAFGLASYAFGCLGLLVMLRTTARLFPVRTALVSLVTVWMASFLVWYMVVEPSMPHAMSTAASAVMVAFWLEHRPLTRIRHWIVLGAIAGVAALVRWQTGVLLLLPLLDHLLDRRGSWRQGAWAVLASMICFAPQWVFWGLKAHSPLAMPLTEHGVSWSRFSVAEVLFSTNRGLFTWSPVIYLSVAGLVLWARQAPRLAVLFLLGFLLQAYVNGSVAFWWSGWSFGSRRFDNCLPFFVVGFAALLEFVCRKPWLPLVGACGVLCIWNFGLMRQSREGRVPPDRLVSFEDVAIRNLQMFYADAGFPFAFPANWYFAWRHDVSPERFDRLFGHPGFGNLRLSFDPDSAAFVGRGWGEAERDGGGRWFRWCAASSCALLVPLRSPWTYTLAVTLRPAPGTSPNGVGLWVNDAPQLTQVTADEGTLTWQVPPAAWRRGTNEIRFEFDRTARPSSLGRSTDSRSLAGAFYELDLLARGGALPSQPPDAEPDGGDGS